MPIRPKTRTLIDYIISNDYKDNQKQDRGMIYAVILSGIEKKKIHAGFY